MHSLPLLLLLFLLTSCSSTYYRTLEKFGFQKRDILVSRVEKARQSQIETKKEFEDALQHFLHVSEAPPSELEKTYRRLQSAWKRAQAQAQEVRDRNKAVRSVGKALFNEWKNEIKTFENPTFKADSRRQRQLALQRFDELTTAAARAEARLDPVLTQFHDHVLYLKHNLNAQAIASLEGQVARTRLDVSRLIAEMERSIAEADSFIQKMR